MKIAYSGINLGLARLSDNLFIDFIAGSLIGEGGRGDPAEVPAYVLVLPLMDKLGRRPILSRGFFKGLLFLTAEIQVVFSSLASHALSVAS